MQTEKHTEFLRQHLLSPSEVLGIKKPFPADNHNFFLNDFSITLIDKTDGSDHTRRKEHCSSLWVKYFKLMVSFSDFYTFFQGSSLHSWTKHMRQTLVFM